MTLNDLIKIAKSYNLDFNAELKLDTTDGSPIGISYVDTIFSSKADEEEEEKSLIIGTYETTM